MNTAKHIVTGLLVGMLLVATAGAAAAQGPTPIGPQWWPSRWGAGDEAGASNLMTRGPVHQELLTRNGIFNHENLDLSELARDRIWEFAYIFVPVPLKGATGSPGSPIAVR